MAPPKKKGPSGRKRKNDSPDDRDEELEALRQELEETKRAQREAYNEEVSQQTRAEDALRSLRAANPPATVSSRRARQLVRWDVDIDIQLLLAIQYCCNRSGTKIPWKEVAETMGPKFTEGAIVQHLSKLRLKREELDKWNPPPLKRAAGHLMAQEAGQKKGAAATNKLSLQAYVEDDVSDESEPSIYAAKRKAQASFKKPQARAQKSGNETVSSNAANIRNNRDDSTRFTHAGAPWPIQYTSHSASEFATTPQDSDSIGTDNPSTGTVQSAGLSKVVKLKVEPGVPQYAWSPPNFDQSGMPQYASSSQAGFAAGPMNAGTDSVPFHFASEPEWDEPAFMREPFDEAPSGPPLSGQAAGPIAPGDAYHRALQHSAHAAAPMQPYAPNGMQQMYAVPIPNPLNQDAGFHASWAPVHPSFLPNNAGMYGNFPQEMGHPHMVPGGGPGHWAPAPAPAPAPASGPAPGPAPYPQVASGMPWHGHPQYAAAPVQWESGFVPPVPGPEQLEAVKTEEAVAVKSEKSTPGNEIS